MNGKTLSGMQSNSTEVAQQEREGEQNPGNRILNENFSKDEIGDLRELLSLFGKGWISRLRKEKTSFTPAIGERPASVLGTPLLGASPSGWTPSPGESPASGLGTPSNLPPAVEGLPHFGPDTVQKPAMGISSPNSSQTKTSSPGLPRFPSPFPQTSGGIPSQSANVSTNMPGSEISVSSKRSFRTELLSLWNKAQTRQGEQEAFATVRKLLEEIPDETLFGKIFSALCLIFPIQNSLRNCTPDQSLSNLINATDRCLALLSGSEFEQRKKLVKSIAKFASEISPSNLFFAHEGEPFNNQQYERAEGGDSTGRTIREVQSFLVVKRENNMIYRPGKALT